MFLYHMLHTCMQDSLVVCIYCVLGVNWMLHGTAFAHHQNHKVLIL